MLKSLPALFRALAQRRALPCALAALAGLSATAQAWDARGHRTITFLALDGFAQIAPDRPAFLGEDTSREMAAYQSGEPDRYRAIRFGTLKHENDPDHYLDVEDLEKFGLTLDTLPVLRYEYLRDMAVARHEHPEMGQSPDLPPYNPRTDTAKTQEFPGYALHAIMEHHAKLTSSFKTLRTLEAVARREQGAKPDASLSARRAAQIAMARSNVLAEMGLLSHFVGDIAQPLHTTRCFNGWVGANPHGYTTDKGFHAFIDGRVLELHNLSYATIKDAEKFEQRVDATNAWPSVIEYARKSHARVEPLYVLEKSGDLKSEPGKAFIRDCLLDGGSMLAALYAGAWQASTIDDREVENYLKYDGTLGEPGSASFGASDAAPAATAPNHGPDSSKK